MKLRHLVGAYKLLTNYLEKFDLVPVFGKDEFDHLFLPQEDVVYSYVVEVKLKLESIV